MSEVKVIRVIDAKVIKARCDASREQRNARPLTHQPFKTALARIKPVKKVVTK